ncbi:hypothetical protein [Methylibium rhizosphaerae]|uniref:hypothetical protein n=1 Tax=Methylibium rhizosphaerae TaxID=2570323 RepID=UPI00112E111A|nr:hypothetical protein [Methylibium rhizosphaerae]
MTMTECKEVANEVSAVNSGRIEGGLTEQQLRRLLYEIEGAKFSIDCVSTQGRALCKALLALLPTPSSLAAAHAAATHHRLDGARFSEIRHSITHGRVLLEETMCYLFDQIDSWAVGDLESLERKLREHVVRSPA